MKLMEDWKRIARKAWSIRLMLLAGILTACEAVLPLFSTSVPQGLFVGLNLVVIPAAMIARITTQKGLD
jgi:hypothetical protein